MPLIRRQQDPNRSMTTSIVAAIVIFIAIVVGLIHYFFWSKGRLSRVLRKNGNRNRHRTSWRESLQSFGSQFTHQPSVRSDVRNSTFSVFSRHRNLDVEGSGNGVDRHASVRSVMTLPVYSAVPRDGEGVIGREGERAGMDTVVEFPETNEEVEDRRETEMESLYQIRLATRREAEERNERRRLRRAARERGDFAALRALQEEHVRLRRERQSTSSAALIAEHEGRPHQRKVSAVSYGDLGVARHDGSRVRTASNDSGRLLLDDAHGMGMSDIPRPWMSSEDVGSRHRRSSSLARSVQSYISDDESIRSDVESEPRMSRPRHRSRRPSATPSRSVSRTQSASNLANGHGRSISLQVDTTAPTDLPPGIQPPPYTSPIRDQPPPTAQARPVSETPSLPEIQRLPSLRMADSPTEAHIPRRPSFPNFSKRTDSWSTPSS